MNKNVLILTVVLLLALFGGGAYMTLNRSQVKPEISKTQPTVTSTPAKKMTEKKSLKDLMSIGDHQECTYTDEKTGSTGTMYIGKGDVRGDFSTQVNGKTIQSHIIQDAESMYMWTDGQKQGMKVSIAATQKVAGQIDTKALDLNQSVAYTCKSWSIKPGSFDVPSDVTFQDFSKMMEGVGSENGKIDSSNAACSACDSLPTESQTQCRTALKCQ